MGITCYTGFMSWSRRKLADHREAAKLLGKIKDETLDFVRDHPQTSELEVQHFVLKKFGQYKLKNEIGKPIVAFRENTAFVHYYPKNSSNKQLKKDSLILLDVWARLQKQGAPYADLTWMAWYGGRPPAEVRKAFSVVILARSRALDFIKSHLRRPRLLTGRSIDSVTRGYVDGFYKGKFLHGTGHELGFYSPHGRGGRINSRNEWPIKNSLVYTIEPGIYLKGKFGVRSEIDFYLENSKVFVTTDIQKSLTLV